MNVKLLLDENLSVRVAETLRKAEGLDVVHARDRGLLEAEDHVVLERAYAEDRILVTCDVDDFIKLAGARELHPGLVLVEDGELHREEQFRVIRAAVAVLRGERDLVNRALRIWLDGEIVFEDILPTNPLMITAARLTCVRTRKHSVSRCDDTRSTASSLKSAPMSACGLCSVPSRTERDYGQGSDHLPIASRYPARSMTAATASDFSASLTLDVASNEERLDVPCQNVAQGPRQTRGAMKRGRRHALVRVSPRLMQYGILAVDIGSIREGTSTMRLVFLACLLAGCSTPKRLDLDRAPPHGSATPTVVLTAMRAELDRSVGDLKAHGDPAPYFAAYEVIDRQTIEVAAEFGALLQDDENHTRSLDVDIRVGSPKLDSSHALRERDPFAAFSRRFGRSVTLPLEDDASALRAALWLTTDERYKDAVERLVKIQSERAIETADDDPSDDFSVDPPGTFVGAPAVIDVDRQAWEKRVKSLSSAFRLRPEIVDAKVELSVSAETRYLTSSDGAQLQSGTTHARLMVDAHAKADDGMDLSLDDTIDATSAEKLPDDGTIATRIQTLIDHLVALRGAPVADPYVGPAILDGRAAGVFFHETFGHRVEGHRQKDDQEGQTFAKKIGEPVMPRFIDVWDDPTVRTLNGVELNGWYAFDDEGMAARRASLVEKGVLKGFLMSRAPTRGFAHSNGHGRRSAGQDVVARQANLVVDPARVVALPKLKAMLLAEVKKQGKPYGLRFADVEGGYTTTARADIQAFKVRPVIVYRVYPDGREELVRGLDLEGTPLASLSTIMAAGDDFGVFNGYCGAESGWVPVSAASPSLLVGQMEVAHKEKAHDKPPILAPPAFSESQRGTP